MSIIATREIIAAIIEEINGLKKIIKTTKPCIAIVRVGNHGDDVTYEKAIIKKFEQLNIKTQLCTCEIDITNHLFLKLIKQLNEDATIHGIIVLRPLPPHLDDDAIARKLDYTKDIDGLSYTNIARVFSQENKGIVPCTPQAIMRILNHLKIDLKGKNVTIVGAGMAVGRPLAIMMLNERATLTVCRSLTKDLVKECRSADILIAAAGVKHLIKKKHVKPDAIVIDVGINVENNKIYGDVAFDEVKDIASYISKVPGGVGSITTYVLALQLFKNLAFQNK